MTQRKTFLTPDGLKQLQEELAHLTNVRRHEVAGRIHQASESGGNVDNGEYDEAKMEQAFVEGRIRDVENILANATVATHDKKSGVVDIGSKVTVTEEGGAKRVYSIVGSAEASSLEGKISNESPVGQALMGHKAGDKVEVETPSRKVNLTITRIA